MEYVLVTGNKKTVLEHVNRRLELGWQLYGPPFKAGETRNLDYDSFPPGYVFDVIYAQAMIKEDKCTK